MKNTRRKRDVTDRSQVKSTVSLKKEKLFSMSYLNLQSPSDMYVKFFGKEHCNPGNSYIK